MHKVAIFAVLLTILISPMPSAALADEPTPTPVVSNTANDDSSTQAGWMFAVLGLGAAAFFVSGIAATRRSR